MTIIETIRTNILSQIGSNPTPSGVTIMSTEVPSLPTPVSSTSGGPTSATTSKPDVESVEMYNTHCCGVGEIHNLGRMKTPKEAMLGLQEHLRKGYNRSYGRRDVPGQPQPFVIFTGVVPESKFSPSQNGAHNNGRADDYGKAFSDFINENNLGKVVETDSAVGITGKLIRVWVWQPTYPVVWEWYRHNSPALEAKAEPNSETSVVMEVQHGTAVNA